MSGNNLWCRKCQSHHHPTDKCDFEGTIREPKQHILKTWPYFFQATLARRKMFEVRDCSDRDFRVGDSLRLVEWDEGAEEYTGRALECRIAYIMPGGRFGLPLHLCVMSLTDMKESHVHMAGETT